MRKTFNWKTFFIVIGLITISIFHKSYGDVVLDAIKVTVTNPLFFYSITCVSFTIGIVHKYRSGLKLTSLVEPGKTKELIADIISALTDPSILISSLSIIKGLFLDYFFEDSFFSKFETGEKVFLLVVSVSFFIHSFLELRKFTLELFYKLEPIELEV